MSKSISKPNLRGGRLFPERQLSQEEIHRRRTESKELSRRCHLVFDKVKPQLIEDHYEWYIVIEPDSGDYFIDQEADLASNKAHEKYPDKKCLVLRINETGACGRV